MANKYSCQFFPICGGCNFLDLESQIYKNLKQENLARAIEAINYDFQNIRWIWLEQGSRRRIALQIDSKNNLGFFQTKTKKIIKIDRCNASEELISSIIPALQKLIENYERNLFTQIAVTLFDGGLDIMFKASKKLSFLQAQKLTQFGKSNKINISYKVQNEIFPIIILRKNQIFYDDFKIDLDGDVFLQATKSGLNTIINIIRNFLDQNKNIKSVIDLYAGFGAYSFGICDSVKSIFAVEGSESMVNLINKNASSNNLSHKIKAQTNDLVFNPIQKDEIKKFDLAIINPPRNGAAPQINEIAKSNIKNLIYVSCNPETFTRDAKILIDCGFKIIELTALDQFYATKHLELIAIFQKK